MISAIENLANSKVGATTSSSTRLLKAAFSVLCAFVLATSMVPAQAWAEVGSTGSGSSTEQGAGNGGSDSGGTGSNSDDQGAGSGSSSSDQGADGASGNTGADGSDNGSEDGQSGSTTPTPAPVVPSPTPAVQGNLAMATVTLSSKSYTYDGKAKKPSVTVKLNGVKVAASNYKVTYSKNVTPTTKATVTVKAKGSKYTGSKTATFTINKAKASTFSVTLSQKSYTYDGKAKTPSVKVKAKVNGKKVTLKKGKAYKVSYKNNKKAGTASVVIAGKGNYTGTKTVKFTIKKQSCKGTKGAMLKKAQGYSSNTKYLILVNCKAHKVGIYKGSKGNWKQVKYWSCTNGAASTPTVKGTYTVKGKGLHFGENKGYTCWYYTQFYGNYLFHSVLYYPGSKTRVKSGILGAARSHGCVRLALGNAKWIYNNIPRGTKVVSY